MRLRVYFGEKYGPWICMDRSLLVSTILKSVKHARFLFCNSFISSIDLTIYLMSNYIRSSIYIYHIADLRRPAAHSHTVQNTYDAGLDYIQLMSSCSLR